MSLATRLRAAWRALRGYAAAKSGYVWDGHRASTGTADVELAMSQPILTDRCRTLYRDNATARAAVEAWVAKIVSTGIDIEPNSGDSAADERMRAAWLAWAEHAGADGQTSLWELQRQAARSWGQCGNVLWHLVALPDPARACPIAIHVYEHDQLADTPVAPIEEGARFCRGIEVDRWGRRLAYHLLDSHPGDSLLGSYQMGTAGQGALPDSTLRQPFTSGRRGATGVRIPASEIIHLYEVQRPGQLHGEPPLAPVIGTIHQEGRLVEYELTSAKVGAAPAIAITSEGGNALGLGNGAPAGDTAADSNGNRNIDLGPGAIATLAPGEQIQVLKNERPNQQIAPFRSMLRGDIAAATRLNTTAFDKDYSKANYSSMRAAQLDERRMIVPLQELFGQRLACDVYRHLVPWLAPLAAVALPRATDPGRRAYLRCTAVPDGFPYVDPEKDIKAAIAGIAAGLSTWQDEAGTRGKDARRIAAQLKREIGDPLLARIFANQVPPTTAAAADGDQVDDQPASTDSAARAGLRIVRDADGLIVGLEPAAS